MKILFYINTLGSGGAERVMSNLANSFVNLADDITLVNSFPLENEYTLDKRIEHLYLEEKKLEQNILKRNVSRTLKLRRLIKEKTPDIVISFMSEPNFRTIFATLGLNTKTLISVRNDPDREYPNFLFRILAKVLYRKANHIVFQTEDAKKWFPKSIQKKSSIIYNQVDNKFFEIEKPRYEQRKGIYTAGRLVEQKNQKFLIKAFSSIKDKTDENLYIYGEGVFKEKLERYIESLGLSDRVYLMGTSNTLEKDLKNAKIFVLSSDYEGCPNSLMEAMVLGIPSISTDCPCGGPKMLSENGGCYLVPCNDESELCHAMLELLTDNDLARELSERAIKTSWAFKSDKVFEKWNMCVSKIIGK